MGGGRGGGFGTPRISDPRTTYCTRGKRLDRNLSKMFAVSQPPSILLFSGNAVLLRVSPISDEPKNVLRVGNFGPEMDSHLLREMITMWTNGVKPLNIDLVMTEEGQSKGAVAPLDLASLRW